MNKNFKTPENIRINNKKYYEKKKQEKEEAKLHGEIVIQEKVYKTPAYIRKAIKAYQNNNPDKVKQWSDLNNSKKKKQNETNNTTIDSLISNEN
jgi:ABC-type nitrate/sulfonate/bicarbonate transport system substrate-binding protein